MNPDLLKLQAYPFERLRDLKAGITPSCSSPHIALSIGEPKHAAPNFIFNELANHKAGLSSYPLTKGLPILRETISAWLTRRFQLDNAPLDPEMQILPVNGTREALFAFAQAVVDRQSNPVVMMPNPFYQIYEGATLLAGAEPYFLNTTEATHYKPDFTSVPDDIWQRCQLLYICTPGNPSGAVFSQQELIELIRLAEKHDFIIASDECYSEIYFNESTPPCGLLQAADACGHTSYKKCVVFHSLSKRSNVPGLRSGFIAGDQDVIQHFLRYRTYHGCAMSEHHQYASCAAWNDEQHVRDNRELYKNKFQLALSVLQPVTDVRMPDASFYLWLKTPIDDATFTRELYAQQNVTVLPGQYLSRPAHGINPGKNHVRLALVANEPECLDAINRIRQYIATI